MTITIQDNRPKCTNPKCESIGGWMTPVRIESGQVVKWTCWNCGWSIDTREVTNGMEG
jgi:hypothetical protein